MRTIRIGSAILALLLSVGAACSETPPEIPPGMPNHSGTVTVKVADFDTARQEVLKAAAQQDALLLGAHSEVNPKGKKHGWLRFRVAAGRLSALMTAIHPVGTLYSENVQTEEHVSEYEELEKRVGVLREHEQRLAGLLGKERRLRGSDILFIQERMYRTGIDQVIMLQRRADIERSAQLSLLEVDLFEPGSLKTADSGFLNLGQWFRNGLGFAHTALYRRLSKGATLGAYAVVFAPLWAPGLLLTLALLALLIRWLRRHGILAAVQAAFHLAAQFTARLASQLAVGASKLATRVSSSRSTAPPTRRSANPSPAREPLITGLPPAAASPQNTDSLQNTASPPARDPIPGPAPVEEKQ